MIGYVRGIVSHLFPDYCFIDVQGIGYRIFIPNSTRLKLSTGAVTSLFTYLSVREDALLLYGFYSQEEYELFQQLISVSGIGPRVALGVLSGISPGDFRLAVSQKNVTALTRLPGIGKKTAERVILELKDKMGAFAENSAVPNEITDTDGGDARSQALEALVSLGYIQAEVTPILKKIGDNTQSVEELIKLVLRDVGRR